MRFNTEMMETDLKGQQRWKKSLAAVAPPELKLKFFAFFGQFLAFVLVFAKF